MSTCTPPLCAVRSLCCMHHSHSFSRLCRGAMQDMPHFSPCACHGVVLCGAPLALADTPPPAALPAHVLIAEQHHLARHRGQTAEVEAGGEIIAVSVVHEHRTPVRRYDTLHANDVPLITHAEHPLAARWAPSSGVYLFHELTMRLAVPATFVDDFVDGEETPDFKRDYWSRQSTTSHDFGLEIVAEAMHRCNAQFAALGDKQCGVHYSTNDVSWIPHAERTKWDYSAHHPVIPNL